jgi:hypothetical protein
LLSGIGSGMGGMRRIRVAMKRADEYDALTRWRHRLYWRPGQRKGIKRRVNKRERRTQHKGGGEW